MIEKNYNVRRELPTLRVNGTARACLSVDYGEQPRRVTVSRVPRVYVPANNGEK